MPRRKPPWIMFVVYLVLFILAELLRPKPNFEDAKPAGLGDFQFPTATEGRSVPLLWGTVQISGPNVIWWGNLIQEPIKETVKTSLFNSETFIKGFRYFLGIQFALCRGQCVDLRRIWIGDDKVFDGSLAGGSAFNINKPDLFGGEDLGSGGVVGDLRFFDGGDNQATSNYLTGRRVATFSVNDDGLNYVVGDILTASGGTFTSAARFEVNSVSLTGEITDLDMIDQGFYTVFPANPVTLTGGAGTSAKVNFLTFGSPAQQEGGDTPAYRGTAYALFEGGYIGTSTNIKPWKFEVRRIPAGPATGSNESINGGLDANPVNVIYEIMTNKDWGLGYETTDIDTSSFSTAGATLKAEGNGYSFILDRVTEALDLILELERQIDGIVYFDQVTTKWKITLARADYDINTVPELRPGTILELKDFSRGAWEDTTNQLRVQFNDRADSYKTTYGLAQDMANVRLQNGVNVSAQENYPGVKDKALANQIAWRQLRTLSYPLAKATVIVDRSFFNVYPGQVLALTDPDLGFTKLPVRVSNIDYGDLEDGRITLSVVQDVFYFQVGSFSAPINTGWVPPLDTLAAFDSDKQTAFEAPRGFVVRDPLGGGVADKIWCGARRKGVEVGFAIHERHSSGTPSGAFAAAGNCYALLLLGRLNSALAAGTAFPTTTVIITPSPDTQSALEAAFVDGATVQDVGTNLRNLILVDSEFMLVAGGAQNSGANVQMNSVYRAVMDSVQANHVAGARVWLLFAGGALADPAFTPAHNVDIKLLPRTLTDTVDEADATTIALTMANRVRKPYPPSLLKLGGTTYNTTIGLEQVGSTGENFGFQVDINRRDYRTVDEIQALTADAATLFADFPTANSTTHEYDLRNDPAGANTLLFTTSGISASQFNVLRIDILKATGGVIPSTLRLAIRAKHTDSSTVYTSLQDLVWDFASTSGLSGQFNFGALAQNIDSNNYTATVNGTYNFTLSTSFSSGDVEFRLNAGAWTTLIAAGNTTGNIAGVVNTDVIEVRHTSASAGAKKFLTMDAPGAGQDGYAVLYV